MDKVGYIFKYEYINNSKFAYEDELGVTLMLEQSCITLTKSVKETINEIINNMKYN